MPLPLTLTSGHSPLPPASATRSGRQSDARDGWLLALGVSSAERDALVPEVPTIAEAGAPGYESILGFALLTSAGVLRPIVATLNREIMRILAEPEARRRWAPIGLTSQPTTPEGFDRMIADDITTFTRLARAGNMKAE